MRMSEKIVANSRAAINGDEAVQHGIPADFNIRVHEAVGPDVRARSNFRGRRNYGRRMNAGRVHGSVVEKLDGSREIQVRILRPKRRDAAWPGIPRQNNCGRFGSLKRRAVLFIHKEGQFARRCFFYTRRARNFDSGIAFQFTTELYGYFSELHQNLSSRLAHNISCAGLFRAATSDSPMYNNLREIDGTQFLADARP
jgi:hypothetical protein